MLVETQGLEPSLREKVLLVQADPQLSSLDLEGVTIFAQHGRFRTYAPGEHVSRAGEHQDMVYLLMEGRVQVTTAEGKSFPITAPGGIGWPSLLTGRPAVDAVATEMVTTLAFDSETILDFFEMNFSLVRNSLRLTAAETLRRRGGLPLKVGADMLGELGDYPEEPATLVQRVMEIRDTSLFEGQNAEAAAALARADTEVRYEPGDVLWRAGETADHGIRLRYGRVRCAAPDGREVVVAPSMVIGMLDVLAQLDRGYDAICETPVVAYRSPATAFFAILEDHFDVAMALIAMLTLSGFLSD